MTRRLLLYTVSLGLAVAVPTAAQNTACPKPASTYELIQRGIFDQHDCNVGYCHGENRVAGLDLRAPQSYDNLFAEEHGEDPEGAEEDGYKLIEPRHPTESLLWLSLAAKTLGRAGVPVAPMPVGGLPLSPDELEGVRRWIQAGAPRGGTVNGVANLINPCPPPIQPEDEIIPPPCGPNEPNLLLPDLVPDPPKNVRVLYRNNHRTIEFDTAVANTGDGPLIIQAASRPTGPGQTVDAVQIIMRADGSMCSRPAGTIFFGISGRRWAYGNMVDFELREGDPLTGKVLIHTSKTFFCLLDTDPIRASEVRPHQYEAHCEDEIGRMGISAGYKDVYHRVLQGQWIDIDEDPTTTVVPGDYYLVNVVDPIKTLSEVDPGREANSSYIRVAIKLPPPEAAASPEVQPTQPSAHPQRTPRAPSSVHQPRPAHPTRTPRPTRTVRAPREPRSSRPRQPLHPSSPSGSNR